MQFYCFIHDQKLLSLCSPQKPLQQAKPANLKTSDKVKCVNYLQKGWQMHDGKTHIHYSLIIPFIEVRSSHYGFLRIVLKKIKPRLCICVNMSVWSLNWSTHLPVHLTCKGEVEADSNSLLQEFNACNYFK